MKIDPPAQFLAVFFLGMLLISVVVGVGAYIDRVLALEEKKLDMQIQSSHCTCIE